MSRWMRWHRARLPELRYTFGLGRFTTSGERFRDRQFRQRLTVDGWSR